MESPCSFEFLHRPQSNPPFKMELPAHLTQLFINNSVRPSSPIVRIIPLTIQVRRLFEPNQVSHPTSSFQCPCSDGNNHRISVYNPATGDLVSNQIPVGGPADVDRAVCAAHGAFSPGSEWRRMTAAERQRILMHFADILEANQERLAYLTRLTLGAPYQPFGRSEIGTAIGCFRCEHSIFAWKLAR